MAVADGGPLGGLLSVVGLPLIALCTRVVAVAPPCRRIVAFASGVLYLFLYRHLYSSSKEPPRKASTTAGSCNT